MNPYLMYMMNPWMYQRQDYYTYARGRSVRPKKRQVDPVRRIDNRAERLVNPQGPAQMWSGKPVEHSGYILPYGKGGYRHGFGDCGYAGGLGEVEQGMPFMAWLLLLGMGGALVYTLLHAPRT